MKLHPVLRWSLGVAFLAALVIWVQLTVGWVEVLSAWGRIPTSDMIAAVFLTAAMYAAIVFILRYGLDDVLGLSRIADHLVGQPVNKR